MATISLRLRELFLAPMPLKSPNQFLVTVV